MRRKGEVALAMMASSQSGAAAPVVRIVPPEVYLRAALSLLIAARRLHGAGVIGRSGLTHALRLSNALSCAARTSWRTRNARWRTSVG